MFGAATRELQRAAEDYFGNAQDAERFVERLRHVYEREHRNRSNMPSAPDFVKAWAEDPSPEPFIKAWNEMCENALRNRNGLLVLTTFERKFDIKVSAEFPSTFLVNQWRSWMRQGQEKGQSSDPTEVADRLIHAYGREFDLPI